MLHLPQLRSIGPWRLLAATAAGVVLVAVGLFLFWPVGVVLGLALGVLVVLSLGGEQPAQQGVLVPVDDLFAVPAAQPAAAAAPASAFEQIPDLALDEPAQPASAARVEPARTASAAPAVAVAEAQVVARKAPVKAPAKAPVKAPVTVPVTAKAAAAAPGVRADLDRLKAQLGDGYPDFARAARLVVSTQYASAARLQRDLHLPYSRARRLLADLETEHFVGPATGTLPRQVLLPKERLPEVERMFAGV